MAILAQRPSRPQTLPADAFPEAVPEAIRERLADYGITGLAAWRALGRKRRQIFGVTARVVAELDALARGAP